MLIRESEPWGRLLKLLQQKAEKAETVSFATEGSGTEHGKTHLTLTAESVGNKQFTVSALALPVTPYRVLSTVSPCELCPGNTATVPKRAAFSHCLLHA